MIKVRNNNSNDKSDDNFYQTYCSEPIYKIIVNSIFIGIIIYFIWFIITEYKNKK